MLITYMVWKSPTITQCIRPDMGSAQQTTMTAYVRLLIPNIPFFCGTEHQTEGHDLRSVGIQKVKKSY